MFLYYELYIANKKTRKCEFFYYYKVSSEKTPWFFSLISFAFPLLSPVAALLWMVYTVWVLTLEYADFPMANHGMTFPQIRERLASKRFLSLGFGTMVMITTLIPLVNFLVMPVAVAGATKMYLEEFIN